LHKSYLLIVLSSHTHTIKQGHMDLPFNSCGCTGCTQPNYGQYRMCSDMYA